MIFPLHEHHKSSRKNRSLQEIFRTMFNSNSTFKNFCTKAI